MAFVDLFRPKHRHSDAAVRAQAVRRLATDEADLIARIARDDRDEAVRRIAIDKLDDPAVLVDIARDEAVRALQRHARTRAAEIWVGRALSRADAAEGHAAIDGLLELDDQRALAEIAARAASQEVREAALAVITDARALAEVARAAQSPQVRRTAIEQIADPDVLRSVAVDDARKDVALAALDRLPVDDALEVVAAKAKSKAVRARARKRLSERAAAGAAPAAAVEDAAAAQERRRHAERAQLVRRAENLAKKHEWVRSFEELHELEQRWAAVGAGDDSREARQLADRFREACERYRARRRRYAAAADRKAADDALAARAREADAASAGAGARRAEAVEAAGAGGGGEAAEQGPAPDGEAGGGAGDSGAAVREAAAESAGEAAGDGGAADEGAADARAADAQAAREREQERERMRQERREESLAALTRLCERLEQALAGSSLKALDRAVQSAHKGFEEIKFLSDRDEPVTRYHAARQAAVIKLQELREAEDWKRWANVPRLEALVTRAQELLASEDASQLGARLKGLQAEWKQVGPAPHKRGNELWQAFKATCDQIYERVKQQRATAQAEQHGNLERKEALCEQAEALSGSTEWDETAERIKALQREWKAIGPVPRKKADALWKRFRAACDAFFERRKPYLDGLMAERERCLADKQALCERAEALAESDDWQETASALRDLQREWKDIGPVPRKDANAINKRFRAACDRFFERREAARAAEREARARQLEQVRDEIERLLRGEPQAGEVRAAGAGGEGEAAGAGGEGAAAGSDGEGGEGEAAGAGGEGAAAGAGGEGAAAEAGGERPDATPGEPASPRDRALAVRAALRALMPLEPAAEEAVLARAGEMYRAVLSADPEAFAGTELDPATSRSRKLKLCARVEELAPPPPSAQLDGDAGSPQQVAEKLRAALAANAMASALAATTDARGIADAIASLRSSWRGLGPVPGAEGDALERRFESACERALRSAGIARD